MQWVMCYLPGFGFVMYRRKRIASVRDKAFVFITFENATKSIDGNRINGNSDCSNISFLEGCNEFVGHCFFQLAKRNRHSVSELILKRKQKSFHTLEEQQIDLAPKWMSDLVIGFVQQFHHPISNIHFWLLLRECYYDVKWHCLECGLSNKIRGVLLHTYSQRNLKLSSDSLGAISLDPLWMVQQVWTFILAVNCLTQSFSRPSTSYMWDNDITFKSKSILSAAYTPISCSLSEYRY